MGAPPKHFPCPFRHVFTAAGAHSAGTDHDDRLLMQSGPDTLLPPLWHWWEDGAHDGLTNMATDEALLAIDHLPRCRYFETPATLIQLCGSGFVTRVLAGQYDEPKPAKPGRGPGVDGERKSAAQAAAEWRRGAMDPEAIRRRAEYVAAKARKAQGVA